MRGAEQTLYRSGLSFVDKAGNYDRTAYQRGIGTLQEVTGHGRERDQLLQRAVLAPDLREPMQVEVFAPYTPGVSIGVRMRTSDVYLTSVHNQHAGFYFAGNEPRMSPKMHESQALLPFTGHYNELGRFVSLGKVDLGMVDGAVTAISRWTRATKISNRVVRADGEMAQSAEARHLLLLCLILSESIRFQQVQETVSNGFAGAQSTPLTFYQIDELVRDWDKRSRGGDPGVTVRSEG